MFAESRTCKQVASLGESRANLQRDLCSGLRDLRVHLRYLFVHGFFVRNTLSNEMLSHDINVRKAMDLITDSAKQVAKAKLEESSDDEKSED